jgi:uncharacterized protein
MDPIVIADAGPLIALAATGRLDLLQGLFGAVHIGHSVARECLAKPGTDQAAIAAAIATGWLRVVAAPACDDPLPASLGSGECDCIRLALEHRETSLIILDDRLARRHALRLGLNIVGTVRLLDLAERRGLLDSAELLIERMHQHGYRIGPDLLGHLRAGGSR